MREIHKWKRCAFIVLPFTTACWLPVLTKPVVSVSYLAAGLQVNLTQQMCIIFRLEWVWSSNLNLRNNVLATVFVWKKFFSFRERPCFRRNLFSVLHVLSYYSNSYVQNSSETLRNGWCKPRMILRKCSTCCAV